MGDTAAVVQPVVAAPPVASAEDRAVAATRDRENARQSRRASAVSKIAASRDAGMAAAGAESVAVERAPVEREPAAKPVEAKTVEVAKPAEPVEDPETKRGLAQIEHARKRFLDEQASHKAELEVQRAEVARLRQDVQGKVTSIEDLKKLDLATMLDKLGLDDSKLTQLSRESYYRTSEGQKNPSAKQAVDEVRQRQSVSTLEQQIADMRRELAETRESATAAQKLVFQREYANEWVEGALKALPADKPTLFARLHEKNPKAARAALLNLGGELEKTTGGEAPSASDVLAEYEKRKREEFESQGIDVEALLAPPAAKPVAPAPAVKPVRTLAVGETQITRPDAAPTTKEERRRNAIANLRIRQRQTADEV